MSWFGNRQRRSLIPWGLCLTIFVTMLSTSLCRPTAGVFGSDAFSSSASSSSSSSPQRKTLDQEIGSPSELAWQAWLLVENKGGGHPALDSSNIQRRITPKSIFIAPELVSCPSGYTSDGKGICKPDPISIDENAQRQFVLKRLNAKFASNRKKPADAAGPLQINIPISIPAKNPPAIKPVQPRPQQQPQQPAHKIDQGIVMQDRLAIPVVISQQPTVQSNNSNQDAVAVVIYKIANDTKKEQTESSKEEKTTLFLETSESVAANKQAVPIGQVVPVAEIVDDMNETFSGVVDYKIPINLKIMFNRSDIFNQSNGSDDRHESDKKDESNISEDSSPTVVLLLSPTKLPFVSSTQKDVESTNVDSNNKSSVEEEIEPNENTTTQTTEGQTKSEFDTTIQTVAPLDMQTDDDTMDSTLKNTEKAYTNDRLEDETVYADDESQVEQESEDHEDYDDTTDGVDQDDFVESDDELLKPGEAGMMISSKNQDLIRSKQQKHRLSTLANMDDATSTTFMDTTTMPTIPTIDMQDSFDGSDSTIKTDATDYTRDDTITTQTTEIPSTVITTEPTTEGTTIFTSRPLRVRNLVKTTTRAIPTQVPTTTTTESQESSNSKEILEVERELVTEPEVILSTQGSHNMMAAFGRKKPVHPAKIMEVPYVLGETDDAVTRTEPPPPLDFRRRHPADHKPQKSSVSNDETVLFKNDDNIPFEFRDQMAELSKASTMNFRRIPSHNSDESSSYVRFPEENPDTRSQSHGYVRFPSDEVNSIHNQDTYKDHLLSPYRLRDDYGSNSPSSTKSSVPTRQKQPSTHWRVQPPNVRMNRQQQQQQQQAQTSSSTGNQRQQKQKPMFLRFWARMPLVRDLSFYPTTSHGSHNEPIGGQEENRRVNSRFSPVTVSPARRVNYYKEMSSHEVNRLLAQQLGQPAIGG